MFTPNPNQNWIIYVYIKINSSSTSRCSRVSRPHPDSTDDNDKNEEGIIISLFFFICRSVFLCHTTHKAFLFRTITPHILCHVVSYFFSCIESENHPFMNKKWKTKFNFNQFLSIEWKLKWCWSRSHHHTKNTRFCCCLKFFELKEKIFENLIYFFCRCLYRVDVDVVTSQIYYWEGDQSGWY